MQQQLQQAVMTHSWIYTDARCYAMIFKHFSRQNDIDQDVLDGPGRVLESVHPRFLVDLARAMMPAIHKPISSSFVND